MNPQTRARLKRTALLSLGALIIGALIGFVQIQGAQMAQQKKPQAVAGVKIGGPYELTDHTGQVVSDENFAGQYKLIYFGFTYCPAICPTELRKITDALNTLGPKGEEIQPLFITIDPERDTVQIMKDYVKLFHPRLIGLTGTLPQIQDVVKNYRLYAQKVQEPEMNDYTMDHSSYIYFMGPDDTLLALYRMEDSAEYIANDIRQRLSSS